MTTGFEERYAQLLKERLNGGGESSLLAAYELGRNALESGLGILDVAAALHRAMIDRAESSCDCGKAAATLRASESFLLEGLSPFELAHRDAREANAALRRMGEAREEEARRVSRELHDTAGQLLAAVRLALDRLAAELEPGPRRRCGEVAALLDDVHGQLRRLSHELRPTLLDDLGLVPALEFLAQGVSRRTGLDIRVVGSTGGRLPPAIETALYRVVQEGLNNVVKHADAARATVRLERSEVEIRCSITDDGVGFDPSRVSAGAPGLGLAGIRERVAPLGGSLSLHPATGRGTQLVVPIPLGGFRANARPAV